MTGLSTVSIVGCFGGTVKAAETTPVPATPEAPAATPIAAEQDEVVFIATQAPTPEASATPTPEPTEAPTEVPTPEPEGLISWSKGGFVPREEASRTETEYVSDQLHFTVTTVFDKDHFDRDVTYFVTDLYIRDLSCLRTFAAKEFTTRDQKYFRYVHQIAEKANALWAMTGDYCGHHYHSLIIRNGVVYDLKLYDNWDLLFLYTDGTMEAMKTTDFNAETLRDDIWQAWQFGPSLLDENGAAKTSFSGSRIQTYNPRSMIGYVEPGHYIFVTVDGRQGKYSGGLSLVECAKLMESLGCKVAFNLDGGESAELYWNGGVYNKPCDGGRVLSDIIYLIDEDPQE